MVIPGVLRRTLQMRLGVRWWPGSICLLLALLVYPRGPLVVDEQAWQPLALPLPALAGTVESPEFVTARTADYRLSLESVTSGQSRPDCWLGVGEQAESCEEAPAPAFTWMVTSAGKPVQTLAPNQVADSHFARREIGAFAAQAGQRYRVTLSFRHHLGLLARTAPKLIVETSAIAHKDEYVGVMVNQSLQQIAFVLGGLGGSLLLLAAFVQRRLRTGA